MGKGRGGDINMNAKLDLKMTVSGKEKIAEQEEQIKTLKSTIASLQQDVDRLNNALNQSGDAKVITGLNEQIKTLKTQLSSVTRQLDYVRENAVTEFKSFMSAMKLDGDILEYDPRFGERYREILENVQSGFYSASEGISRAKIEFADLIGTVNGASGSFDTDAFAQIMTMLTNIQNGIQSLADKMSSAGSVIGSSIGEIGGSGDSAAAGLRELVGAMGEMGTGGVTEEFVSGLLNVVYALKELGDGVSESNLSAIASSFGNIGMMMSGKLTSGSVDNIVRLAGALKEIGGSGFGRLGIDFSGFKDVKISSTVNHITTLVEALQKINPGQVETLTSLGGIDFSKFNAKGVDTEPIRALAEVLPKFGKINVEELKKLDGLTFSGIKTNGVNGPELEAVAKGLQALSKVKSEKVLALRDADLTKLNGVKVDEKSFEVLAAYLPEIAKVNVSRLEALSKISLANFNHIKVDPATMKAIASLADIAKLPGVVAKAGNTETAIKDMEKATADYEKLMTRLNSTELALGKKGDVNSPQFTALSDEIKRLHEWMEILKKDFNSQGADPAKLRNDLGLLAAEIDKVEGATKRYIDTLTVEADMAAAVDDAMGRGADGLSRWSEASAGVGDATLSQRNALEDSLAALQAAKSQYDGSAASIAALQQALKDVNLAYIALIKAMSAEEASQQGNIEAVRLAELEYEKLAAQMINLQLRLSQAQPGEFAMGEASDAFADTQARVDEFIGRLNDLHAAFERDGDVSAFREGMVKLRQEFASASGTIRNYITVTKDEDKVRKSATATLTKAEDSLTKWAKAEKSSNETSKAAYGELKKKVQALRDAREAYDGTEQKEQELRIAEKNCSTQMLETRKILQQNGEITSEYGGKLGALASRLMSLVSPMRILMALYREVRQMISASIELDKAMSSLQIVTGESTAVMAKFGTAAVKSAREVGAEITDIVDATTTYARLGYTMQESLDLAQYTTMLQNVGDIEAQDAQDSITAIVKAYGKGVDDVEDIMNKLVKVGNGFPISVSQIAEGMNNASSTLAAAGNTFEQSVALLTAANTVVQNAAKASTGLRTITARLRNTTVDLEELGEDMTEAKYEEVVKSLTDMKVALTDVNGEYRSTYDIMKDIAEKWGDMDSMEKAALATQLAGTRQQAIFYSIIEQFNEAEGAMAAMSDSANTLRDSYDVYMQTATAHINQLKSAFKMFGKETFTPDMIKHVVDFAQGLLKVASAVVKVINAVGGIKTLAIPALIIAIVMNAQKLWTLLSTKGLVGLIKNIATAFTLAKQTGTGFKGALDALTVSGTATQVAISGIVAVVGILIGAISRYIQKRNEMEQERLSSTMEAAQKSKEEYETLTSLYDAYNDALEAYNNGAGSKDQLTSATHDLLEALGFEDEKIKELRGDYDALTGAIDDNIKKKREGALDSAVGGYAAAKEQAIDDAREIVAGGFGYNRDDLDLLSRLQREGFVTPGTNSAKTNRFSPMDLGIKGIPDFGQELTNKFHFETYEQIEEYVERLNNIISYLDENLSVTERTDSKLYTYVVGLRDSFGKLTDEANGFKKTINNFAVQGVVQDTEKSLGLPETAEEYTKFRDAVSDAVKTNGDFVGSEEEINEAVNKTLSSMSEFGDAYDKFRQGERANKVAEFFSKVNKEAESAAESSEDVGQAVQETVKATEEAARSTVNKIPSYYAEFIKRYKGFLSQEITLGGNPDQTVFGNIDIANAGEMFKHLQHPQEYWDAEKQFLRDHGYSELWHSGNMLGLSDDEGMAFAVSTVLKTENGEEVLNAETLQKYLRAVVEEAMKRNGGIQPTEKEILEIDAGINTDGIEIDGKKIKNIIAGYSSDDGSTQYVNVIGRRVSSMYNNMQIMMARAAIESYAEEIGSTFDEVIAKYDETALAAGETVSVVTERAKSGAKQTEIAVGSSADKLTEEIDAVKKDVIDFDDLTDDEIDFVYRLLEDDESVGFDEVQQKLDEFREKAAQPVTLGSLDSTFAKMETGFTQLAKIYKDVADGGAFDWSSIINNAEFTEVFGSCKGAYEDFIETIRNSSEDISAAQPAFNELVQQYISANHVLDGLTEDTAEYVKVRLRQMGVDNADELVTKALAYEKEKLALKTRELTAVTIDEIIQFWKENEASSAARDALAWFALEKISANKVTISTSGDIQNIISLANAAGVGIEQLHKLALAKRAYYNAEVASAALDAQIAASVDEGLGLDYHARKVYESAAHQAAAFDGVIAAIQNGTYFSAPTFSASNYISNAANIGGSYSGGYTGSGSASGGGGSGGSGSGSGSTEKEESWFEREYKRWQHLLNMEKAEASDYLDWLEDAYKRAYDEEIISLDDFRKYEEEVYKGRQTVFKDFLSERKDLITLYQNEEAGDAVVLEAYREIADALTEEIARAKEAGFEETSSYFKFLTKELSAAKKEIRSLEQEIFKTYIEERKKFLSRIEDDAYTSIAVQREIVSALVDEMRRAKDTGIKETSEYFKYLDEALYTAQQAILSIEESLMGGAKDAFDQLIDMEKSVLKQQVDDEKDALNKRLDALREFYAKQKEMLQDEADEEKYLEEQKEKRKAVADIQDRLRALRNDNSAWAERKRAELTAQLAEAQKALEEFERDNARDDIMDWLDAQLEAQEELINKELEELDNILNNPHTLFNRALEEIKNATIDTYNALVTYNNEYGDGDPLTIAELWENAFKSLQAFSDYFGEDYRGASLDKPSQVGAVPEWNSGDVDNDGAVTADDARLILRYLKGKEELTPAQLKRADVNNDGKVTQEDFDEIYERAVARGYEGQQGWYTGDIDGDGEITSADARLALRAAVELEKLTADEIKRGDIDRDGMITAADVREILRRSVGLGYASGTPNATPGLHRIDEEGSETIFSSSNGNRYRMFTGGEKVLNARASQFLYDFANNGVDFLKGIADAIVKNVFLPLSPGGGITIKTGDININGNANEQTVSQIRRAQRENVDDILKAFRRLKV